MKTYYLTHTEVNDLLTGLENKFHTPFDTIDGRDGCLVDNFIGSFTREGYYPFTIMATEHYLNEWSSDLKVTIARTERDNKRISKSWDDFVTAYDKEFETEV